MPISAPDSRRWFLAQALRGGALLLLTPFRALAAWQAAWFEDKKLDLALARIGATQAEPSPDLILKAPTIAEDGAVVPVEAESRIPGTYRLVFLIDKNPFPVVAVFDFSGNALPAVGVRLRFGETSAVRVIAYAGDKVYATQADVKVTVGGCGG